MRHIHSTGAKAVFPAPRFPDANTAQGPFLPRHVRKPRAFAGDDGRAHVCYNHKKRMGGGKMVFAYGAQETSYLKRRDKRLGAVIERVGHIERAVDPDLFSSVVHHIVGQQVSMRAQATIWGRLQAALGTVDAPSVAALDVHAIQGMGMSMRKAGYILDFARRVQSGEFPLEAVRAMDDAQAIAALTSLKGVGVWTAEMILLFCLQRPDVLSYDDLAIRRGLRMLYRHKTLDRARFERYRRRYSPCGSVASLYLWAVACGAIGGLDDPAAPSPAR